MVERGSGSPCPPELVDRAREWLARHPVPPGPGSAWDAWRDAARSAPVELVDAFIELLERGDGAEQYGALLALRESGIEAWAEGYGDDLRYVVKIAGRDAISVTPGGVSHSEPSSSR